MLRKGSVETEQTLYSKVFRSVMLRLNDIFGFFQKHFTIASLAATILVIKLLILNIPSPSVAPDVCMDVKSEGCGFIFDEAHYVPAVRKLMRGEAVNNEHPPLSKFIIMAGMLLLGDHIGNAAGWRIFIAIFGVVSVIIVGLIARELSNRSSVSYIASLLFATDVMSFNLSSIAMLDAPAMTFSLVAIYFTIKKRYILVGTFMGLSLLCKLSFLNMLCLILIIVILQSFREQTSKLNKISFLFKNVGKVSLLTAVVFLLGLWIYDRAYGAFQTPIEHIKFMLDYHAGLKYTDPSEVDMPFSWINPISPFKPAPYYVETVKSDSAVYHPVAYWGIYSPLWWSIWILVPIYLYKLVLNIKRNQTIFNEVLILSWVAITYLPYFPIAHILERWVFPFYFYATVPALAIGLCRFKEWGDWTRMLLVATMSAQLVWFFIWFPVKNDVHITILRFLNLPT